MPKTTTTEAESGIGSVARSLNWTTLKDPNGDSKRLDDAVMDFLGSDADLTKARRKLLMSLPRSVDVSNGDAVDTITMAVDMFEKENARFVTAIHRLIALTSAGDTASKDTPLDSAFRHRNALLAAVGIGTSETKASVRKAYRAKMQNR